MSYVPNTEADRVAMLKAIGARDIDELFHDIPQEFRYPVLNLPPAVSELEVLREMGELSEYNLDLSLIHISEPTRPY